MTDTIRVSRSLAHGRNASELAEDLPYLRKAKEAVELAQFIIEGARERVRSAEGRKMIIDLEEYIRDAKHDAAVNYVVGRAEEAEQLVGTVNIRVVR